MAKPARITAARNVSHRCSSAFVARRLRLLERVVDCDRESRMRLLGQPVHRLRHAVEEERLCLLLAAMAVGRGHQLFGLGHSSVAKRSGKTGFSERRSQT